MIYDNDYNNNTQSLWIESNIWIELFQWENFNYIFILWNQYDKYICIEYNV